MTYLIFYDENNHCVVEGCTRPMVNLFHKICLEHSKDKEKYPDCDIKTCKNKFLIGCKWLCSHTTLYDKRQDLCSEWDFQENGNNDLYPDKISCSSNKMVSWICNTDKIHKWSTTINTRTNKGSKCPYCSRKKVSAGQSLAETHPSVAKEFHPTLNGKKTAWDILSGSGILIWWKCSTVGVCECHEWQASPNHRTNKDNPSGCPFCHPSPRLCPHNNLLARFPEVAAQWDVEKNGNLSPKQVMPGDNRVVSWICGVCSHGCHRWNAQINSRSWNKQNCPFCAGQRVCPHSTNSLTTKNPEIAEEWHPTLNGSLTPDQVSFASAQKIVWLCKKCNHDYTAVVYSRTRKKLSGCPRCASSKGESKIQITFERLELEFTPQYVLKELPLKKFDFLCKWNNKNILIEYDGEQHFYYCPYFHKNTDKFIEKQSVDILKTKTALENNYYLVRIDFEEFDNIEEHISNAFRYFQTTPNWLYLSNTSTYDWLIDALENW